MRPLKFLFIRHSVTTSPAIVLECIISFESLSSDVLSAWLVSQHQLGCKSRWIFNVSSAIHPWSHRGGLEWYVIVTWLPPCSNAGSLNNSYFDMCVTHRSNSAAAGVHFCGWYFFFQIVYWFEFNHSMGGQVPFIQNQPWPCRVRFYSLHFLQVKRELYDECTWAKVSNCETFRQYIADCAVRSGTCSSGDWSLASNYSMHLMIVKWLAWYSVVCFVNTWEGCFV